MNTKNCKHKDCEQANPQSVENFAVHKRYADGRLSWCKQCKKKYDALRYIEKRESILSYCKLSYENNKETFLARNKKWMNNNKEYFKEYLKTYNATFPEKARARCRKYQAAKLNALPCWINAAQIKEMADIYNNCPDGHEVDHIVPLQGENVSGLHVPWNLQYLTISENRSKYNKY